ncbi:MAG: TetR/AcrR family transcriptional regulator [Bacteroidales bacterium]|nr:TetR/AcrR family transcriptional regulator [Bacteroidales bacterium]
MEIEVKTRILNVARKLFIERGYTGTSIRDIASEAGVNVAMVNYYFNSKQNLFEIIFDESVNILLNKIFGIIHSDLPFYELLDSWVTSYYDMLMQYNQLPIFVLNEINQHPEHIMEIISKRNPPEIIETLRERISEEIKKGNIKEVPVENLLLSILSLCVFPFMLGGLITQVTGKKPAEYYEMLDNHKRFIIDFVINAVKTK